MPKKNGKASKQAEHFADPEYVPKKEVKPITQPVFDTKHDAPREKKESVFWVKPLNKEEFELTEKYLTDSDISEDERNNIRDRLESEGINPDDYAERIKQYKEGGSYTMPYVSEETDEYFEKEHGYLIKNKYDDYAELAVDKIESINIAALKFIKDEAYFLGDHPVKHVVVNADAIDNKLEDFTRYYNARKKVEESINDKESGDKEAALVRLNIGYDNEIIAMFEKVEREKAEYKNIMSDLEDKGGPVIDRVKKDAYKKYPDTAYALGDIDADDYKSMCNESINGSKDELVKFHLVRAKFDLMKTAVIRPPFLFEDYKVFQDADCSLPRGIDGLNLDIDSIDNDDDFDYK